MPNPQPGDGALVGTVGQVLPVGTLYLAPYLTTPTAPPGAALQGAEPAGAYVRQGLLKDDMFTVDEKDPDIIEYRRGFRQRYFGEVVRKAGERTINAVMDEVEPSVIAKFTGETITAETGIGSPAAGGLLELGSSEYYHRTLLAVYHDALSNLEFQIYSPHVLARYKMSKQAEFMTFDLIIKLIPFVSTTSGLFKDIAYYMF
jgi:hypothetical protein